MKWELAGVLLIGTWYLAVLCRRIGRRKSSFMPEDTSFLFDFVPRFVRTNGTTNIYLDKSRIIRRIFPTRHLVWVVDSYCFKH